MDVEGRLEQNWLMPNPTDDRQAIQDLIVTYAACIDDRDFARYRGCFAEDVEFVGFGKQTLRGIDAWMSFVSDSLERYRATQHMLGVPLIEIDENSAAMRTDLQACHFPKDPDSKTFIIWATYETKLVRTDAGWRIAHHRLVPRAHKYESTS